MTVYPNDDFPTDETIEMTCQHEKFRCNANIGRLSKEEGGPITGYTADITVTCAQCDKPFRFVGLPAGSHPSEPRVSVDGIELRAPLEPADHERFIPAASYTMPLKPVN